MKTSIFNSIESIADGTFNVLVDNLERNFLLSTRFKTELKTILFEVTYKKGSHILNAGAKQPIAWFSLDGLLQEITVDKDTFATKTTWFWSGFAFVYAAPGFFDQQPSQITINVVRDSKMVIISHEHWKVLKEAFEETEKLTEILRSNYEMARKQHLIEINTLSTVARYLKYQVEVNQLLQHIQLKPIAEFTGMSTDTLGKLRRRFVKEKHTTI